MERLTRRYKEKVYYARCYDGTCNDYCYNEMLKCEEDAIKRLAEYEDTEITPEQILQLDKLYSEKCRELAEYKRRLQKEWIPCSERIPEEGKTVLVWFEYFRYGNYNKPFQTWGISYTIDEAWSGFVIGNKPVNLCTKCKMELEEFIKNNKIKQEDQETYDDTMKRMKNMGIDNKQEAIIYPSKEIEYYRGKLEKIECDKK